MENVKVEYSSFYLEAMKSPSMPVFFFDSLASASHKKIVVVRTWLTTSSERNDVAWAVLQSLNAQAEMRLLGGAVKTWIPTKED